MGQAQPLFEVAGVNELVFREGERHQSPRIFVVFDEKYSLFLSVKVRHTLTGSLLGGMFNNTPLTLEVKKKLARKVEKNRAAVMATPDRLSLSNRRKAAHGVRIGAGLRRKQ